MSRIKEAAIPTERPPRLMSEKTGYFRRFRRASFRCVLNMCRKGCFFLFGSKTFHGVRYSCFDALEADSDQAYCRCQAPSHEEYPPLDGDPVAEAPTPVVHTIQANREGYGAGNGYHVQEP